MKLDYNLEVSGITQVVVKANGKTDVYTRKTNCLDWSEVITSKDNQIKVKDIADKHVASRVRAMYRQPDKYRMWIHHETINFEGC